MAFVYLSPSTQEFNPYIGGGTEEFYMNLIADELEIWFRACGISFTRNTRDLNAALSIEESNAGRYSLHLALHSNAAPPDRSGMIQGTDVYYSPASPQGQRAADLITQNLKRLYPRPELVKAVPTSDIGEVAKVRAPAVLIEFAYHDNPKDSQWIRDNISEIAGNVAKSLTEFFSLPFLTPQRPRSAQAALSWGTLNLRSSPSYQGEIIAALQNGTRFIVWNQYQDWYVIKWGALSGFVLKPFVRFLS